MANKRIRTLMNEAVSNNAITPEQTSVLESALRENMHRCGIQSTRSLLLFAISVMVWFLIRSAHVEKLSVMNIELKDLGVALLLLPLVAAFSYYQYQASMMMTDLIQEALREIYTVKMQPFAERGLGELLTYPVFLFLENSIANLETEKGFFSNTADAWALTLTAIFALAPAVLLLWVSYLLIRFPVIGLGWSIAVAVLVLLLVTRTLVLFVHLMRRA